MADKNLFSRLRRLFSTNVIVRNVGGKKLKIADTEKVQAVAQRQLVDRYNRLYNNMSGMSGYNQSLYQKTMRLGLFRDYEAMDSDPIIASALDIYADESTLKGEYGKVVKITTDNSNIHDILHNLYYDILNIEFNLYPWVRNLVKYGDFFLKLDISEQFGITNVEPISAYDITRVEGDDPTNPHYVKYVLETGDKRHSLPGGKEQSEFENYEVAHFRMLADSNFLPYGRSQLEGGRKIWKQLSLMEDAMLIHRIMRAPEKRVFKIDIGNIPPAEVDQYMQKIVNKMKKAPVLDDNGQYNLKYNIQNLTEDFFMPVRGGDSGTQIDSLGGLDFNATDDIEYLRKKLMAALRIPSAFIGYEEQVEGKATLAAQDVRFARTIERIQRIIVSELTKIGIVHLYAQGYTDQDLVNFDLELTNPSTVYEQEKLELLGNKISLARDMIGDGLLSSEWVYKNIFNFTDEQKKEEQDGIIEDFKEKFRRSQIENEGNDPSESGQAQGTPSDMAMGSTGHELNDKGGAPEGGFEGAGRPKEISHYGKDGSARGRDPIGKHDLKKAGSHAPKYGTEYRSGLALAHLDKLKGVFNKKDRTLINETTEVEKEYESELSSSLSDT